jgi:hypothetical protein
MLVTKEGWLLEKTTLFFVQIERKLLTEMPNDGGSA